MTIEIKNCATCGHSQNVSYSVFKYCNRLQKQLGYGNFGECTIELKYYIPKKKWWKLF